MIAFYTGRNDLAHISFVHEANQWFPQMAEKYGFTYDSTTNWSDLNTGFLSHYQVVIFLDTQPEDPAQRKAFEQYMENGGAWMGCHFAGIRVDALGLIHKTGAGITINFWARANMSATPGGRLRRFYAWKTGIIRRRSICRKHSNPHPMSGIAGRMICGQTPDIKILLSIDPASFPLGTGPKPYEIWHKRLLSGRLDQ